MREFRTYGSVRGAPSDGRPCRDLCPGVPQRFADEPAAAFLAVPGVHVAVGHGNMIMDGQEGLIVPYDHDNLISASVFDALAKAGLDPIDGPPTPGTPVVFIKVAPR